MDRIHQVLESYTASSSYLVSGVLRRIVAGENDIRYANSVMFLNKQMVALQAYDKYHLVPFGEFIPFQDWIPLKPVAAFKGFERGTGPTTIERTGIPPFSPLICYEVIFPDQLHGVATSARMDHQCHQRRLVRRQCRTASAFRPDPMRAIGRLPVVRAANTGISGVMIPWAAWWAGRYFP